MAAARTASFAALTAVAAPSVGLTQTTATSTALSQTAATNTTPRIHRSVGAYIEPTTRSKRSWSINNEHALIWDGAPYLPVGGTFTPRSLDDESESAWHADTAALDALKAHGIRDVIVWPSRSLIDTPQPAMNRLLAALDERGFTYGISFGQGLTQCTRGYVIRPSINRFEDSSGITAIWQTPDADAGAYFVVDADKQSLMVRKGLATIRDSQASAPIDVPETVGRPIALLVPRETPPARPDGVLPDVWSGFDIYRDRLMSWLGGIKFGPGLRFFLDPIARNLALTEETSSLVPDSDAFQLEWESYLTRKYSGVDEVRAKWLISDEFKSMQELSRLVPLWSRDRGFPYLYDPATGNTYLTGQKDAIRSSWWDDFIEYRDAALSFDLNALADLLKLKVADVPVLASLSRGNQSFILPEADTGIDGVMVSTEARDPSRLARTTGPAFSFIQQTTRTLWYVGTLLGVGVDASTDAKFGYGTPQELANDLAEIRQMGVKGYYVGGFQVATADRSRFVDWLPNSTDLDWLHAYATTINSNAGVSASLMPHVLYYPAVAPGPAQVGMVPGGSGTVWLPSTLPGRPLDWWPSFSGYALQTSPTDEITVLMSLLGPRKVDLTVPDATTVHPFTPGGAPVGIKRISKTQIEVYFGSEPIVFETHVGQELVPIQAAGDALLQLNALAYQAHEGKAMGAAYGRVELDQAATFYKARNYSGAFAAARQQIDTLTSDPDVAPYVWLEAENTPYHNFTEIAPNPAASGGGFLRLSTPNSCSKPPKTYAARFAFNVAADTEYEIWLACTPPGPTTSPFTWYLDRDAEQEPADPRPQGPLYLSDHFGWIRIGTAQLKHGQHALSLKVNGRAPATQLYSFSLDAVMIVPTARQFKPDTIVRPIPIEPAHATEILKTARNAAKHTTGPTPADSPFDYSP